MEFKDFLDSMNYSKKPLLDNDEKAQKLFQPYVTNRFYSFFVDTIFYANEMNCNWQVDKKSQFDFYRLSLRKKKRFSKWIRKDTDEKIELVKKVFNYTDAKAKEVLNILGPHDFEELKKYLDTGGFRKE